MADPAPSAAERQAEKMIRRQKRNLRKARAEGFLDGLCAMLGPGDLAVDCGANQGEITARLARTGADVLAIEPDPWCFARLQERFADHPRVTLMQAALGTAEGEAQLLRPEGFDANPEGASVKSTLLPGARNVDGGGSVTVQLVDFPALLSRLLAERGAVALVKMDIEGAELDILEALHGAGLLARLGCVVAETHENKFPALRPRFKALRAAISDSYPAWKVNLDWI